MLFRSHSAPVRGENGGLHSRLPTMLTGTNAALFGRDKFDGRGRCRGIRPCERRGTPMVGAGHSHRPRAWRHSYRPHGSGRRFQLTSRFVACRPRARNPSPGTCSPERRNKSPWRRVADVLQSDRRGAIDLTHLGDRRSRDLPRRCADIQGDLSGGASRRVLPQAPHVAS
jgi:hypothetical protein